MFYLIYALYIIFSVGGLFLIKTGGTNTTIILSEKNISMNIDLRMAIGLLIYVISFLLYIWIIKNEDISYIVPLTAGILNVISVIIGVVILKEKISYIGAVGILFVIVGIVLMNFRK